MRGVSLFVHIAYHPYPVIQWPTESTPFGHGRPYSRSQIIHLLRETWFTPTGWSEALYVPPITRAWFLRSAVAWERTGATISAPFAGVHIVEGLEGIARRMTRRNESTRLESRAVAAKGFTRGYGGSSMTHAPRSFPAS